MRFLHINQFQNVLVYLLSFFAFHFKPSLIMANNLSKQFSKANSNLSLNDVSTFLIADPGSLKRKEFAHMIERVINGSLMDPIIKDILNLTIASLQTKGCPRSDKIRVYKSLGAFSFSTKASSTNFILNSSWRQSIKDSGQIQLESLLLQTQKPWETFAAVQSIGDMPTMFLSFSLNPNYVSDQGPAYIVAEVCPERMIFPPKVVKDLQELEVFIPLFLLPEEIISVKGRDCLSRRSIIEQKDCAGVLADNTLTLTESSKSARSCYANFGHIVEYKYMDDSPVDLLLIDRFESISKEFSSLFDAKYLEDYRHKFLSTLAKLCKPDCAFAKKFLKSLDELSENGESEISADIMALDAKRFQSSIDNLCRPSDSIK